MKPTKVNPETEMRDRASRAIAKALIGLHERGEFPPELVFEGAIRGAAALLLSKGVTPEEVSKLIEDAADEIRRVDISDLVRAVQ